MDCPRCRTENPPGSRACRNCGASLDPKDRPPVHDTKTLPLEAEDILPGLIGLAPGTVIAGKYRIEAPLGRGGMGIVYRAEQTEPIRRPVALKVIKLGMDTEQVVARFESERQALALMNHPNIARVFDAGTTREGRPFFVMEYIPGVPVSSYCDAERLSVRDRLELFIQVCDGVQHAHQKGIIHRDIKSSNVLVAVQDGRAVPKIIDFGVAKATAQRLTDRAVMTEMGQILGTPEYMSPEQVDKAGLDIDTRADVYSLGVLLYELLAGMLPFAAQELRQSSYEEILHKIRDVDPPRPSVRLADSGDEADAVARDRRTDKAVLLRQLRGELDWLSMKALAKDRSRRYPSASEFAADVRRYLRNETVQARPPSLSYRTRKFVRRHRLGVAAGAVVVLALAAGIAGTTLGLIRARASARLAQEEADKATAINSFLQDVLGSANPIEGRQRDITVLEALKGATEKIHGSFADQPAIEAQVRFTIGLTYLRLGRYPEAEDLLRSALSMFEKLPRPKTSDLIAALNTLAVLRQERGDLREAESLYGRALDLMRRNGLEDSEDYQSLLNNLALVYQDKKDYKAAELQFRKILEFDRKRFGPEHENVASDLNSLGWLLTLQKDYAAAEPLLRQAEGMFRKLRHPWLAVCLGNLGYTLGLKGDCRAAEPLFSEALAIGPPKLGEASQDMAKLKVKYSLCLIGAKRYQKAEEVLSGAYPILRDSLGPGNEWTDRAVRGLAEVSEALGKRAEAARFRALIEQPISKK